MPALDHVEQSCIGGCPAAQQGNGFMQPLPRICEAVFRLWRYHGIDFSNNETFELQLAKDLNQHLLRDVWNLTLKLVEAPDAARQTIENDRRPLVTNQIQNTARWITFVEDVRRCAFDHDLRILALTLFRQDTDERM